MGRIHRVAVIQLYSKPLELEDNFQRAATFVRNAASQGCELALLPEYHLTSWVPDEDKFVECCGKWELYLRKYQELARECQICIVPGTIVERHKTDSGDDTLLNTAYFIDANGQILGKYVKKNLWHPERPHLTSSGNSAHDVFETPLGPVGMLICWDLAFPEAFRELILKGAKIIIIPSFWKLTDSSADGLERNPSAEQLFIDSMLTSRTFENTCAIIYCNAGGPYQQGFAGLSQVTVPFIGPLCRLGSSGEGMSVVDLDTAILDEAEDVYKVRADLKREDWHYICRN